MSLTKTIWFLAQCVLLAHAVGQCAARAEEVLAWDNPRAGFSLEPAVPAEQSGEAFAFTRSLNERKNTARLETAVDFDSFLFSGSQTAKPDVVAIALGAADREFRPASQYLQAFEDLPGQNSRVSNPLGEVHWAYITGSGLVALSVVVVILKLLRRARVIEEEGIEHEALAA